MPTRYDKEFKQNIIKLYKQGLDCNNKVTTQKEACSLLELGFDNGDITINKRYNTQPFNYILVEQSDMPNSAK